MEPIPFMQTAFDQVDAKVVFKEVQSGFVGPGITVNEFGNKLKNEIQRNFSQLTTSGTVALSVAVLAAGLKNGDEILVPSYGVISTIHAFSSIGLIPRLVDINISTGSITLKEILNSITPKTKAICYVNFAGNTGKDLVEIEKFCKESNLILIEDAACAMGNSFCGRMAGSFGNISTFSLSAPKIITTGQGGVLLTNEEHMMSRVNEIIDLGDMEWRKTNFNRGIGSNLRYTNIQAAFGMSQLSSLRKKLNHRKKVFEQLKGKLEQNIFSPDGNEAPLFNIILSDKRKEIQQFLKIKQVSSVIQYRAIYEHPPYHDLKIKKFYGAEYWSKNALFLPFGNGLSIKQSKFIASILEKFKSALHNFEKI